MKRGYLPRLVDALLAELLAGLPAVLVVGPRASGKTTTSRRHARSIVRLDRPAEAEALLVDPDVALTVAGPEPVLIDEWQVVPAVLGAVKRAIDDEPRPGRFVLTGSVGADLTAAGWPATGRVVRVPMWGLSQRELAGLVSARSVVDVLFDSELGAIRLPEEVPDVRGYVELALRGGFPEVALQPSTRLRRAWLAGYVDQLVIREPAAAGLSRDPQRLRRYLAAVAVSTAGAVEHKTLYDAADVNRATAVAYDSLLESLFVTERVPAWATNRLSRITRTPKRYLVDPALLDPLAGMDVRGLLRDADQLGRLVDTFVLAQLRPELAVAETAARAFHVRQAHGRHEVDLVLEAADGRVVGIEVKAASAPGATAARHLEWMRDELGDLFVAGVVFHTGPRPYPLGDRLAALPICTLWGPH